MSVKLRLPQTSENVYHLPTIAFPLPVVRATFCIRLPSDFTSGQWVTAARKGLGTPGSRTVAELESEILQLRKALNEARLERDILKKATVEFQIPVQPPCGNQEYRALFWRR